MVAMAKMDGVAVAIWDWKATLTQTTTCTVKNDGDIDHVLTAIEAMMGATKTSTLATRQ